MKNSFLILILLLSACGKPSNINQDVIVQVNECNDNSMLGSNKYIYFYSQSGNHHSCTTGCHLAQSLIDYCADLQDDALNNYCARDKRQNAYNDAHCE